MTDTIKRIDHTSAKGKIRFRIFDKEGNVKEIYVTNTFVQTGNIHVADRLDENPAESPMGYIAIGTGDTPFTVNSTALNSELDRNVLSAGYPEQRDAPNDNEVVYKAFWAAGDGTGALTEAGIFNSSIAGSMLAASTFPVVNKGDDDSLEITWEVTVGA